MQNIILNYYNNCSGHPANVKDTEDWSSNQKLFNHYEHAKIIQSICSIHQILSDIHLVFESHDPKGLGHFWAYPPNNY